MNSPSERRSVSASIADLVLKGRPSNDRDALANDLAEGLIPADALQRLLTTLRRHLSAGNESLIPSQQNESPSRQGVSVPQMREYALKQIETAAGGVPRQIERGQTYRVGDGPTIYLRTRARDERQGDHIVYWFGLRLACWEDPDAWFVLQCALDFSVVVRVEDWLPYRDQIGLADQGNGRQPHVHREGNRTELREATGLVLDISQWVDNWDAFGQAH